MSENISSDTMNRKSTIKAPTRRDVIKTGGTVISGGLLAGCVELVSESS